MGELRVVVVVGVLINVPMGVVQTALQPAERWLLIGPHRVGLLVNRHVQEPARACVWEVPNNIASNIIPNLSLL